MAAARVSGPRGSESCRAGFCRFELAQLWSEDCARFVVPLPPNEVGGVLIVVVSGKNVSVWPRSLVMAWVPYDVTAMMRGSCGALMTGSTTTLPEMLVW